MQKKSNNISGFILQTYNNLLVDIGVWLGKLAAKLNGEPAPEYEAVSQKRRSASAAASGPEGTVTESAAEEKDILTAEREDIARWLKSVKFRSKIIAGVDETDVWKKIAQLNRLYDKALLAERARYDALICQYREDMKAQQSRDNDISECEVENGDSQEGKQLDSRKDNN